MTPLSPTYYRELSLKLVLALVCCWLHCLSLVLLGVMTMPMCRVAFRRVLAVGTK
ncbi:hypothetical protein BDV30DRAFT_207355 [Aspergillus minisclerotigenes]|uniref:Uncharacterized protein n=1 Tax=Aspergillus minisclerotigenes TaxID=656917 RepID=A0A5N6JA90_9EURO|nr:hypothetical protein BDV30DRAFT_207355 [Aspergillus minisclerotigenes]